MLTIAIELPRDRFVLKVDESLDGGCIWAIMGHSGCGKTSLLRTIAGLERSAIGTLSFNGEVWQDSQRGVWVKPERRGIGYIFQESRLFPHLSVVENLHFARQRVRVEAAGPTLSEVVEQLAIDHLLNRSVDNLSGGEKQRVAIARTLLSAPRLLLMDEPLASLDWSSKAGILSCLKAIHQRFAIPTVMVSHAREEVARLADKLLIIDRGQVVSCGDCRQLLSSPGELLARDDCALSVLDVQVAGHDDGFTELTLGRQTLLVNEMSTPIGTSVRAILPAREVSIITADIDCISIQNRVSVTIESIREVDGNNVLLFLAAEQQMLLALVTRRAMRLLGLACGQRVFACFKASCLSVV